MNTVCILTAGKGTRMGKYSEIVNKSLLPLNNKAIITHIINFFGDKFKFIIALGYHGQQVKDYLLIAHPKINFTFINIKNYDGPKSGPGESLYACKKYLNKSFFFISCDTIIKGNIKKSFFDKNFVGTSKVSKKELKNYCNFDVSGNVVSKIFNKKAPTNKSNKLLSFAGYSFIKNYKEFWTSYKKYSRLNDNFEIFNGYIDIINKKRLFYSNVNWVDVGNYNLYEKIKLKNIKYDFSKNNEFIYFLNNKVIKFNSSVNKNKLKIKKYNFNKKVFPENSIQQNNFIYYDFINGKTFYKNKNKSNFQNLLFWLDKNLWLKPKSNKKQELLNAKNFYNIKTYQRYEMFITENRKVDNIKIINNLKVKKMKNYLDQINWKNIYDIYPSFIHGDLQFDNILFKKNQFKLIDWRESFGNSYLVGDIYYDLGKLLGGIYINYDLIKLFKMKYYEDKENIKFDVHTRRIMESYKFILEEFINLKKLDFKKVQIMVPIIYLNMSPLHNYPFNNLLFSYSKILFEKFFSDANR